MNDSIFTTPASLAVLEKAGMPEWPHWAIGRATLVKRDKRWWVAAVNPEGSSTLFRVLSEHEAACLIRDDLDTKLEAERILYYPICGMHSMIRDIGGQLQEHLCIDNKFREVQDMGEIKSFKCKDVMRLLAMEVLLNEKKNPNAQETTSGRLSCAKSNLEEIDSQKHCEKNEKQCKGSFMAENGCPGTLDPKAEICKQCISNANAAMLETQP